MVIGLSIPQVCVFYRSIVIRFWKLQITHPQDHQQCFQQHWAQELSSSIERMKVQKKLSNHLLNMTVVGLHNNLCCTKKKELSHTSLTFDHLLLTPSFTKLCTVQGIRGIKTTSCYISKHNSLRNLQIIETQKAFNVQEKVNHSYKVGLQ